MVSVQCTECLAMFQIGTRLDRHTSNSRLSRDLCLFSTGLKFEPSEAPLLCTSSRINPKGSRVRLEAGNLSASIGQNHFIQNNLQAKSSSDLTALRVLSWPRPHIWQSGVSCLLFEFHPVCTWPNYLIHQQESRSSVQDYRLKC